MQTAPGGIFALGTASHAYLEFDLAAGSDGAGFDPAGRQLYLLQGRAITRAGG